MASAAASAREEVDRWGYIGTLCELLASDWRGPVPTEEAVTGFDASSDLQRRGDTWAFTFGDVSLGTITRFAAGLAAAEADAWESNDPSVATRALSDRRFLMSDRLLHWAVPWLVMVGSSDPEWAPEAMAAVQELLELGDGHRPAPALTELEGTVPPGHDSFGPILDAPDTISALGGWLFVDATNQAAAESYEAAAVLWADLADSHPGSARLWLDLERRARWSSKYFRGTHE